MSFDNLADFLAMGGHAVYVWSAYGVTMLVLIANVIVPVVSTRRYFREQKQALRRQAGGSNSAPVTTE